MATCVLRLLNTRQLFCHLPCVSADDMQRRPYTSLTLPQLRQELARRGLAIPPSARKINLVQALDAHDASSETLPTASFSSQTSHTRGPARPASPAAALTHTAREAPNEALETAALHASEALYDVHSALIVLKQSLQSHDAIAAILGSFAYMSGGYTALSGRELELVTHWTVSCCRRSQSTTGTNTRCRMQ